MIQNYSKFILIVLIVKSDDMDGASTPCFPSFDKP